MNERFPLGRPWWAMCFALAGMAIVIDALRRDAPATELFLTVAGAVAFAAAFFAVLLAWRHERTGLLETLAVAVLGAVFAPTNGAAWIFIVVACAFAAVVGGGEVRKTSLVVAAIIAIALVTTLGAGLPWTFFGSVAGYGIPVAAMCALTLRRALAVRELARQGERERISRDMHDVLGHTLSVIVLKVDLAARLARTDPDRVIAELTEVERIARDTLEDVRQTLRGYRARTLEREFELAKHTLATAGLAVSATFEPPPLPLAREQALCLALREGVTNIVRHARASRCTLSVSATPNDCVLVIEDDGAQAPLPVASNSARRESAGGATAGAGLQGMRERIAAIGGTVTTDASRGMRLTIRLPLAAESGAG